MSVENFIITVYCLVDDMIKKLENGHKLRKRGFNPALSDSEMITMEVVSEFLSIDTDKEAWEYFSTHWRPLFPALGSRSNFAKHAANLWVIKQLMQKLLATGLGAFLTHFTWKMASLSLYASLEEQISAGYLQVKPHLVIVRPKAKHIMASKVIC